MTVNLSKVRFSNTAMASNTDETTVKLSPNPSNGKFSTTFNSTATEDVVINVVELATGRIIGTQSHKATKGNNVVNINLNTKAQVAAGMYIINIKGDSQSFKPAKLMVGGK